MTKKEIYDLTKEMLFAKYDGRCAFCGHELGDIWCIWNIDTPVSYVDKQGNFVMGREDYENKMPACKSCDGTRASEKWKGHVSIEAFRRRLWNDYKFIQGNVYYKKMLRYELIYETGSNITFYFETYHKGKE